MVVEIVPFMGMEFSKIPDIVIDILANLEEESVIIPEELLVFYKKGIKNINYFKSDDVLIDISKLDDSLSQVKRLLKLLKAVYDEGY
jgi:hypothetical protein